MRYIKTMTHPSRCASPLSSSWMTPSSTLMVSWLELIRVSMAWSLAFTFPSAPGRAISCPCMPCRVSVAPEFWLLWQWAWEAQLAEWGKVWDCACNPFSCAVSFLRLQLPEGLSGHSTCVKDVHAIGPEIFEQSPLTCRGWVGVVKEA